MKCDTTVSMHETHQMHDQSDDSADDLSKIESDQFHVNEEAFQHCSNFQ